MKKGRIYGYARISTPKQKVQRQVYNIKKAYPDAQIITESFTGAYSDRPKFQKLINGLQEGDTIVFDEVSRMSRNASEGMELYERLYNAGVDLIFLKEPHINTSVYKNKIQKQVERLTPTGQKATDKFINGILEALQAYTIDLAREQIELAFKSAQKELEYLHKRTSEGVRRAQAEGKQIGRKTGAKIETAKAKAMKVKILELSKDFNGICTDVDVMKVTGLARGTYYKYKRELKNR